MSGVSVSRARFAAVRKAAEAAENNEIVTRFRVDALEKRLTVRAECQEEQDARNNRRFNAIEDIIEGTLIGRLRWLFLGR
jgi:hypothetical protein